MCSIKILNTTSFNVFEYTNAFAANTKYTPKKKNNMHNVVNVIGCCHGCIWVTGVHIIHISMYGSIEKRLVQAKAQELHQ